MTQDEKQESQEHETIENPETNQSESAQDFTDKLRQSRDELKLQTHLFGEEVKDRWKKAEENWENFYRQTEPARQATKDTFKRVTQTQKMCLKEIAKGYKDIKNSLKKN